MRIFIAFVVLGSRLRPSSVSTRTETYHTPHRRLTGACGHAFAPGEKQICCDHLADKSRLEPIRIKTFWEPALDYNSAYKQFVTDSITEATNYWMSALSVHRIAGNLYAETTSANLNSASLLHFASSPDSLFWQLKPGKTKTDFMDELSNAFSCGPNNVLMPAVTRSEVIICESGKNSIDHPDECETIPQQTGVPTDLALIFYLEDCGQEAEFASAVNCQEDQCGRSTFGAIQICKESIQSLFTDRFEKLYSLEERQRHFKYILIHEIAHVLGFDSSRFQLFRHPDGSAMVPHDDHGAISKVTFSCDSTQVAWPASATGPNPRHYVDLATSGIVKLAAYHGHDISECQCAGLTASTPVAKVIECLMVSIDENKAPSCVFVISTPKVKAAAQEYYGCPTLEGMPLENRPTAQCSIYGSHWEGLAIKEEAMTPSTNLPSQGKFVSKMSLALLEDSGWYGVDYSFSTELVDGIHWGYNAGCDFLQQKCGEGHPTEGYYCTQNEQSCSRGLRQKVKCSTCATGLTVLPVVWQYFNDTRKVCDSGRGASNCPVFVSTHFTALHCAANYVLLNCRSGFCQKLNSGGNTSGTACSSAFDQCKCTETADANSNFEVASEDCRLPGLASWFHGETHGAQSYCFMSTWYQIERTWVFDQANSAEAPRCFTVACAEDRLNYTVFMIRGRTGNPVNVGVCTSANDTIDPSGSLGSNTQDHYFGGRVACHAPEKVCRTTNNLLDNRDFSSSLPHVTDAPAPTPSPQLGDLISPQESWQEEEEDASKSTRILFGLPCVTLLALFF
eukprot:GEMP01016899.1.p1 GENE.GEMP01016899.1~~GEMP01016899.1.p1  ORF type:complete len:791 (+),score=85.49 GEMP01016899.1:17-2389(+)